MADERTASLRERVEQSLAAYRQAQEAHGAFFQGSCPYQLFPGAWQFCADKDVLPASAKSAMS